MEQLKSTLDLLHGLVQDLRMISVSNVPTDEQLTQIHRAGDVIAKTGQLISKLALHQIILDVLEQEAPDVYEAAAKRIAQLHAA